MSWAEKRRQKKLAKKAAKMGQPLPTGGPLPDQNAQIIQQALGIAIQHHSAGELSQAEGIYQQILEADPNQPDALHYLGVLAHQMGNNDVAVELIGKALAIKPNYLEAHTNLGLALQKLGRLDEAVSSFHKALTIKPDYAEAHNNLGTVLKDQAKLSEAVDSYHKALAIKPDYAEAYSNLGLALQDMGNLDEAVECYHKALAIKPDYPEAHNNLGNALKEQGKMTDAVASYHKAIAIKPDYALAHSNLGAAFQEQGMHDDAVASFRDAIAIKPDYAEAYSNLGATLQEQGKHDDAVASFREALAIRPEYAEVYCNLGNALIELGKPDDGVASFRDALTINPDYAEAHVRLASYYWVHGALDDCKNTLARIKPKKFQRSSESDVSFYILLKKLMDYRADHPQLYDQSEDTPSLYALGESHSLPAAHMTVSLNETPYRVEPKFIVGCRAWHLGNEHNNIYKIQFERCANSLPSGTTAVVMFGEIDCRPDEGILPLHKRTGDDLPKMIEEVVQSYVKYVTEVFSAKKITPIFYGVPARIARKGIKSSDDETESSFVVGEFNKVLAIETKKRNIPLLDVYSLTNDADGQSSGELHIDTIHVFPSVFGDLIKQL